MRFYHEPRVIISNTWHAVGNHVQNGTKWYLVIDNPIWMDVNMWPYGHMDHEFEVVLTGWYIKVLERIET
jgi:hypothetical protein